MPLDPLAIRHTSPLEREYEAWIVAGIEDYFKNLGMKFAIWAVSPSVEAKWPADEKLTFGAKVVGLQFKQAKLASKTPAFNPLKWALHQPAGQFALVQKRDEIFYCLPTFINRDYRTEALHHCLFWRPSEKIDYNAWYDNPAARTPYNKLRSEMRWGHFVELLFKCPIGKKVNSKNELDGAVQSLYAQTREYLPKKREDASRAEADLGLYALVVSIKD